MKNNVAVLLMCATTIIMVAGIAYGLTNYWIENVSRTHYEYATTDLDDKCRYDVNGRANTITRDFTAEGKTTKVAQFTCDYTVE